MNSNFKKTKTTLTCFVGVLLVSDAAHGQTQVDDLAERLIALRSQVESLYDAIEAKQQDRRNRMNALTQRVASLESEIQSKELQLRRLKASIDEQREKNRHANTSAAAITPTFESVANLLTRYIDESLPFKGKARKKSVADLVAQVRKGDISAPQGLARLWGLYEDEFRVTRENGLFTQEIVVDGKEQLSDVIRLGSVMLFFRTDTGLVGFADRSGGSWSYKAAEGTDAQQIEALFDAFEKQVRSGFFEIPNALQDSR